MTHKTKGLVLRAVKYGETSLVVTAFTELFGLQSYMVNGVRAISKKGGSKAVYFQPGALLEMVVYQNEFKNLQRIKEYKWSYLYKEISSDVMKNAVAVFMLELLTKCLKEPEPNPDIFHFTEDALLYLDTAPKKQTAVFPLYFALHLPVFFGFRITDNFSPRCFILDLQEGVFIDDRPSHPYILEGDESAVVAELLKIQHPSDLNELQSRTSVNRNIIAAIETYYALHVSEFGSMKTLPVLRELSN